MGFRNGQPIDQSTGQYWDWRGEKSVGVSRSYPSYTSPSNDRSLRESAERALETSEARYEKLLAKYNQLREQISEIEFERDCRDAAVEEVEAHSEFFLRRGHLIVDDRLLVEHWWVTSGNRIIDPSLMGARGGARARNSFEYLPIDPEGEEFDFSVAPPMCMQTWGKCQVKPVCEWCAARQLILEDRPDLLPATIAIQFQVATKKTSGPWKRDIDLG